MPNDIAVACLQSMERVELDVTEDQETSRLDVFLLHHSVVTSRRQARKLCEQGVVFVDGTAERAGYILQQGQRVHLDQKPSSAARPEFGREHLGSLKIVFEDESLLIVNKPREMFSVRLGQETEATLADLIAAYCPKCLNASENPRESGLLQRLDFHTSGLIIAAKNSETWKRLREELFASRIEKYYTALVEGALSEAELVIAEEISQSPDGRSMRLSEDGDLGAMSAETRVQRDAVLEIEGKKYSLLSAFSNRTRRHQIRLHLSSRGHPLVGDKQYGSQGDVTPMISVDGELSWISGFQLHAEYLRFWHPWDGSLIEQRETSTALQRLRESFMVP